MEDMSPEDVRDMKMRKQADMAYRRSLRNTPEAPAESGITAKPMPTQPPKPIRSPMQEQAIQEAEDEKARRKIKAMGYKKGGSVSSASSRADGIASKGKTKGRFV